MAEGVEEIPVPSATSLDPNPIRPCLLLTVSVVAVEQVAIRSLMAQTVAMDTSPLPSSPSNPKTIS